MIFLLNRVHMPYYKWAFRALGGLELLSELKVPLEEIGMDIIRDNVLKAAFIRVRPIQGSSSKVEYTSWKFNRFHKPATFGTLTLQR